MEFPKYPSLNAASLKTVSAEDKEKKSTKIFDNFVKSFYKKTRGGKDVSQTKQR
jgi:hypothetical protein